ncbi:MAG: hypothetical protein Q4A64_02635 [Porphyromonadaceae bacterium]|nr:hypothetical protein [Porphyromonadaceae bacterium]
MPRIIISLGILLYLLGLLSGCASRRRLHLEQQTEWQREESQREDGSVATASMDSLLRDEWLEVYEEVQTSQMAHPTRRIVGIHRRSRQLISSQAHQMHRHKSDTRREQISHKIVTRETQKSGRSRWIGYTPLALTLLLLMLIHYTRRR